MKAANLKLADEASISHPNKIPFTCSLFSIGQPSDGSPHGADGKLIRVSSAVCDQFLSTFEGMGVNIDYQEGMSDHDTRFKVGIISKTFRSMDGFAMAEGYIFGKDFPDVVATIRYYNGLSLEHDWPEYKFGTSIEMEAKVTNAQDENVLDVLEFCGTGAAILFADKAAYKTTSFAARNNKLKEDVEMTPEQIQAMQDSLAAVTTGMATLTASVQTIATEVATIKTEVADVKAAGAAPAAQSPEETATAALQAAQDKLAAAERELTELKAAAIKPGEPERKTLAASQLLSKYGAKAEDGEDTDIHTFCASVDKLNLSPAESTKLKLQARAELSAKGEN
ncbi:3-oxoacyl-ACP reductase [Paenibacillus sp. BIHB 4019]|uniref:3-oxoacyl-ACP reductase n=2 Tax=Paenibacillus sp. BIHB 4019 TaxID=1870819 RepID=A0A1B2DTR2_9BACL|nr:3-oxoacyl-ACP reductase [Paenibacillus sp. BIHB 4019]